MDTRRLRALLRNGPYAWPGGYPMFLVTNDGAALCFRCARAEYRQISTAIRHDLNDGWQVTAHGINWEDSELFCDHCGEQIETAYTD